MQKISYKPRSVRELLTDMKDTSDLMIDLARATLLFESVELAERVRELEEHMNKLMYQIRVIAAVAARNVEEAGRITGILQVASAAEAISNSTDEIVDLVLRRMDIHPVAREAAVLADEKLVRVEVGEGSVLAGKRFQELKLPSSIGVRVLALKREKEWVVPPVGDTEVRADDMLIAKGPKDGIGILCKMAGGPSTIPKVKGELPLIGRALAEMYDSSGMMVDMAYSSILLGSREVAMEVRELEERFDKLNYKLWLDTLKTARKERNVARLNSLLQIVKCLERISNAADSIVDVVARGLELHPVFAHAIAEADEQIARVDVSERSELVGRTLGELNLWTTMGAYVLVIKRGKRYFFDPGRRRRVQAGDSLIVRGSQPGVQQLKKVAGGI